MQAKTQTKAFSRNPKRIRRLQIVSKSNSEIKVVKPQSVGFPIRGVPRTSHASFDCETII